MPLCEPQRDVDPRLALGHVVEDDEDVLVCHGCNCSSRDELMRRLIDDCQAVVDEFAEEVEEVIDALAGPSFRTG